jgi:hypothetical protein
MKKFFTLIFFFIATCAFAQNDTVKTPPRSIALILKIHGDKENITNIETFKFSFFYGRAKVNPLSSQPGMIHVVVKGKDKVLFDSYVENPLMREIESFNADGTIERVDYLRTEEYINLRFPVSRSIHEIFISCFSVTNDKTEKLIDEFSLPLK